ncbi:midasin nuclear AAA ATPase [Melanogaster broomeanus]|nr:midasin nuclear AAA ATPase [Melanogaster broomeanus]
MTKMTLKTENHEELFPLLSAFLRQPCFSQGPLGFIEESSEITVLDATRLHRLLLAYYRLLRANRLLPGDLLWPISPLSTLFVTPHPDTAVAYLAIRCYALHTGMAEVERTKLETRVLGESGGIDCPMLYEQNIDGSQTTMDGWLLPALEHKRVHDVRNSLADGQDFYSLEEGDIFQPLSEGDLSMKDQIITVHLADTSLDPRSLLGSYISSPTQLGTFEWKDGVVVRAMKEGKWLVFEDIDRGSMEVLGLIKPLAESIGPGNWIGGRASIDVPNKGTVRASERFALFATRSVSPSVTGKIPSPTFYGAHKFHEIVVNTPSPEEVKTIVESRFPKLGRTAGTGDYPNLGRSAETWSDGFEQIHRIEGAGEVLPAGGGLTSFLLSLGMFSLEQALSQLQPKLTPIVLLLSSPTVLAWMSNTDNGPSMVKAASFEEEKDVNGDVVSVLVGRVRLLARPPKSMSLSLSTRPFAMHKPAVCLLSRIASAISLCEPVLLTGETGTGKTSAITHLASVLRRPLISLNLSHQTESSDLLGGFKPVDARVPALALHKNVKFEESVRKAVQEGKWKRTVVLWRESVRLAKERIQSKLNEETQEPARASDELQKDQGSEENSIKRCFSILKRLGTSFSWMSTTSTCSTLKDRANLPLISWRDLLSKRFLSGDWILLDEINLASPETLECITGLLHGPTASITLTEKDVGKKDLPPNIRARFTEIDVPPPDADRETLLSIIHHNWPRSAKLADGSNHRPHYSMRTLTRALTFAADIAPMYGLRRALWEGCLMAFTMFGPFYLEKGPLPGDPMEDYIMTPSVEKKLIDLVRIVLTRRFPVLIEGPTSSGKTSAVEYLARRTGHQFIRINNHEHTDIQEYIGSYVSDPVTGKLVFKDGLLLNLAPTDVLEALNRLLDDNRELVIPETQEVVRPHPHFMLFATQNPPGLYAGRKVLSRAFRNRFLEVHFQDVPQAELESILCQRCRIAPSYGQRIVNVFRELQKRRQTGRVFESKQGFATLRDLDAVGYQELAENGYMLLAERARRNEDKLVVKEVIEAVMKVRIDDKALYNLEGPEVEAYIGCPVPSSRQVVWTHAMRRLFVLVARALRFNEPVLLVGETGSGKTSVCQLYAEVLSKHLHTLSCHQNTETADLIGGLRPVRNRGSGASDLHRDAMSLLAAAGVINVPTDVQGLLTQISLLLNTNPDSSLEASLRELQKSLLRSESLFEWHDGPLIRAMWDGDVFLLDEISLADDSVLERLNSVLEPGRTIVLAERGGTDGEYPAVRAAESFKLLATMNPGGDYGKKELSPALRNRFTEIWVPQVDDPADLQMIVNSSWTHDALRSITTPLLQFADWLRERVDDRSVCTLRDMLAWVAFSNAAFTPDSERMRASEIFHHAAHMTFLDGLGSLPQTATYSPQLLQHIKDEAVRKLHDLIPFTEGDASSHAYDPTVYVQLGPFAIPKGPGNVLTNSFNLQAPTARENAMRVVRACQVPKSILLEGSPGVGKTSLITALAKIAGYHLCRINLSDQTDLIDLFGTDLPVENGAPGEFAWKEAEFLQAMQQGHWVLLDEMNLAPQAVLEGLNAVLDHRGTVYIPELGQSFTRHPSFRVVARKGLPKSFLDRFTKVYVEELTPDDMLIVCREHYKDFDDSVLRTMIAFNTRLNHEVVHKRSFGREGSPWEFNLRDIIRWGDLLCASTISERSASLPPFRNWQDRTHATAIFNDVFSTSDSPTVHVPYPVVSPSHLQIGYYNATRHNVTLPHKSPDILQSHLTAIEAIGACLSRSWLVVVTGHRHSGNYLDEVYISSATDTADILGGFEQVTGTAKEALHQVEPTKGRFEWVDGPLIRAMKHGHWLVLDGANMCNPSVLDRLNSLCEPNGVLVLSERGFVNGEVQILTPHPNFRLFMTVDPQYGELSRAMRNRSLEVSLLTSFTEEDRCRVLAYCRLPDGSTTETFSHTTHEEARRGIIQTSPSGSSRSWPSIAVDHDSLSSSLAVYAPIFLASEPAMAPALVHFAVRALSPSLIRIMTRYFKFSSPDGLLYSMLVDTSFTDTFKTLSLRLKEITQNVAGLLDDVLPMDDFMVCPPCSRCTERVGYHSNHALKLQILDFFAALLLDKNNDPAWGQSNSMLIGTQSKLSHTLGEAFQSVLVEDFKTSAKLLSLSGQLRQVLAHKNFDHSYAQVLSKLISKNLDDHSSTYDRLSSASAILEKAVSPSSGLGLVEMWSQLRTVRPAEITSVEIRLLACTRIQASEPVSRRKQLQILALATLPIHLEPDEAAQLAQVSGQVKDRISDGFGTNSATQRHCNPLSLLVELQALCDLQAQNPTVTIQMFERLIEIALQAPNEDLRRFASYQHLLWNYDVGREIDPAVVAAVQTQWLEALWNQKSEQADIVSGPNIIFHPIQLLSSLSQSQLAGVSLLSLEEHRASVQRHLGLSTLQCFTNTSRLQQLNSLFNQSVVLIVSCFATSFDESTLRHMRTSMLGESLDSSRILFDLLGRTTYEPLRKAIQHLSPALQCHVDEDSTLPTSVAHVGRCWIALSRVIIDLFVPDVPIDPAAMIRREADYSQEQSRFLMRQIVLHSQLELRTAANQTNSVISYLEGCIDNSSTTQHVSTSIPARDSPTRLQTFWSEVSQFISQVVHYSKIDDLTLLLESQDASAFNREVVVQESISGFCQRMESLYSDFDDITCILRLAFAELRLGLHLVRCSSQQPSSPNDATELATSLVAFPSTRSTDIPAAELAILNMAAAVHYSRPNGLSSPLTTVWTAYERVYRLWSIDRARDAKDAQDLSSLYRRNTTTYDASTEAESEEKEFLELFPTFEDSFTHLKSRMVKRTVLQSYLGIHVLSLPDSVDRDSLHQQLSILHAHLAKICGRPVSYTNSSNFYTDANILEATKASNVIQSLRARLVAILQDWPDQTVLQHLIDRCDVISAFDFASPVAKFLTALEQLVLQTEDWEIYSFGGVAEFWFRLYRGPHTGAIERCGRGLRWTTLVACTDTSSNCQRCLTEFMQSSSLGQFQARLDLLQSFEVFIHHIVLQESDGQEEALRRVGHIVHASWRYFCIFAPQLSASLSDQRRVLEKEVEAFIKLASWKDINVQALKQSAQRTHHQLYKIIRKFRDVLRQPVTHKMNPLFAGDSEGSPSNRTASPAHLGNLRQTFDRFHGFIDNRVRPFLMNHTAEDIEQLSVDIISTTKYLANHVIPSDLTKEKREKYKKNLLLRKRKAWSDLLKELKRGGLASNLKPEVLNQLRDECWIREQPLMPANDVTASTEKGEYYFDRLRGCLPALRNVLSNHHSDLGTRDLDRGITLVESGFSLALEGRSLLFQVLSRYTALRRQADRLRVISDHSETVRIDWYHKIEPLHNALSHSARALEELADGMRLFSEIEKSMPIPGHFSVYMARSRFWSATRQSGHHAFNIAPSVIVKLSLEEYNTIVEAASYLNDLPGQLQGMSSTCPQLIYILQPTEQWIREQGSFSLFEAIQPSSEDATSGSADTQCPEPSQLSELGPEPDELADNYIRLGARTTSSFTALLDLSTLEAQLTSSTAQLSSLSHVSRQQALRRVLPFVSYFLSFASELLESLARWTRALFKLDYILCSVVHTLGTRGFCIPPETEEGEGAEDETGTKELEGTGLGEGTGNENVSKEIEDESQVEGLKGEEREEGEGMQRDKGKDEENTIEMSEDFGGEMEDVPDESDEGDDEEKGEDEQGPDEQLGKLDKSDPAAVDEKLWGDEAADDEGDGKGDDELLQDRSQENQRKESDVVAKQEKTGKQKEQMKTDEKEGEQDEGGEAEEGIEAVDDNSPDEDVEPPNASGAPMDEHIPEANTLDLPDDVHIDKDQDMAEDRESDLDINEEGSDEEQGPDDQMDEDRPGDRALTDDPTSDELQTTEHQPPHATDTDEMDEEQGDVEAEESDESAVAQPDLTSGDGDTGMADNEPQPRDTAHDGQQGSASTQVQKGTGSETSGEPEPSEQRPHDAIDQQPRSETASTSQLQPQNSGSTPEGTQRGPVYAHQPPPAQSLNPLRDLGDALKDVQQRFDEIFGPVDQSQPLPVPNHDDAEKVEYAHDNDAPESEEMQALGPAGEEQVVKLRDLKLVDEDEVKDGDAGAMDIDDLDLSGSKQDMREAKDVAMEGLEAEKTAERSRPDVEGAIVHTERDRGMMRQSPGLPDPSAPKASEDEESTPEPGTLTSEAVLTALTTHASDPTPVSASHLWSLYTNLTASLSLALCESLRLILAPTLATRLRGDFRSGKRLNMRRVVEWVASEYTKDRIWMRRVKPSGREYQVLLAVDDSASMRNGSGFSSSSGGAVHLAYQTVVLVVQALGKLEVGEVGVARFGEGWELIRGFGSDAGSKDWGSSPTEGGRVLNSFTFSQSRTDVAAFLEGSLSVLEAAREKSNGRSGKDLWQLEIIISDGICQDHERLRRTLRKARGMRVLVVFIVIDALNTSTSSSTTAATYIPSSSSDQAPPQVQSSILTLSQVSYKPSPSTGLMELSMERYLDSFPFEYYVVLRDVESLPRVLADTLREFFEKVNEE